MPVADRVDRDGAAVVLVGRAVVRLSPLATTLLDLCADWTELPALTEALVERFGDAPDGADPAAATLAALTTLRDLGLVDLG